MANLEAGQEVTARVGDQAIPLGWRLQGQPGAPARLAENLAAIVAMTRERGAQPVLLTYASDSPMYRVTTLLLLEDARSLGVPLIDVHERFKGLCPGQDCQQLFFPDSHANAAGNAEVAATIAAWLDQRLAAPGP